jgi:glycosyltransferase involved in cell wall biosynthesis
LELTLSEVAKIHDAAADSSESLAKTKGTPALRRDKSVLIIAPQPFFENRGTPINVRAIAETLASFEYQVDLLVFPYGDPIELEGITVHRSASLPGISSIPIGFSWAKVLHDFPLMFKAFGLLRSKRYDMIHGIEEGGCIAGLLSRITSVPYVFDMDSCMQEQLSKKRAFSWPGASFLLRHFEAFFMRGAKATLTVCHALTVKAKDLAPKVPVFQIEDFPYEEACVSDDSIVESLRKEFATDGKRILLYTGNFESYQGIDLLLESFAIALKQLGEKGRDVCLMLVGGGALGSPKVERIRKLAEELGVIEQVIFTGNRPAEEMGSFMTLADVLLSPRKEGENTPLKLYSYMLAERPIVATSIASHTQVLDEKLAFLAEPNAEAFSKSLVDVLAASAQTREQMCIAAKKLVEDEYSYEQFKKRLGAMYEQIIFG